MPHEPFSGHLRKHRYRDERMKHEHAVSPRDLRSNLVPQRTNTITRVQRAFNCCYKVANVQPLAAGEESNPYPVYWPVSGMVRMMKGSVIAQPLSTGAMAAIGVEITILDGREDLFKSAGAAGNAGADFNIYSSLFGANGDTDFILERPITAALAWQVTFKNFDSDNTYTPDLTFYVDEDPRGVHRFSDRRVEIPEGWEIEIYSPSGRRRSVIATLEG